MIRSCNGTWSSDFMHRAFAGNAAGFHWSFGISARLPIRESILMIWVMTTCWSFISEGRRKTSMLKRSYKDGAREEFVRPLYQANYPPAFLGPAFISSISVPQHLPFCLQSPDSNLTHLTRLTNFFGSIRNNLLSIRLENTSTETTWRKLSNTHTHTHDPSLRGTDEKT